MPRLIDLRMMAEDHSSALLECLHRAQVNEIPPPLAVLVQTELDAKEFARYWNTMQVATPQPGRRAWLRVHDPRVLHQLLRILNTQQRRKLFGQSTAFTYWAGGEWLSALADDDIVVDGSAAWDWARVERIGIVNRALHGADVRKAAALAAQSALAEQLIERANKRHGLISQADMVEFAIRGLTTRTDFDEHPTVAPSIRPESDPDEESSLADRLALIDDSVWLELLTPLHMQKRHTQ
jgi:hypothetical protein